MTDLRKLDYAAWLRELERDPRTLVIVERPAPDRAILRLNDPENHNALSGALTVQIRRALVELVEDLDLRSIVLTGEGDDFSVGGDWKLMVERAHSYTERDEGTTGLWRWIRNQFGGIARLIAERDKVVIAAVNGPAAGVALAWALNCDLVVAAEEARLVTAFGRIGLVPEVGTNWVLTRRLGYARAFELFVRGNVLTARDALELGLVNEVVPRAELLAAALRWCDRIARLPEHVVAMTKPLMRAAADMTWQQAIVAEELAEPNTFTTKAHQEAIRALLSGAEKAVRSEP